VAVRSSATAEDLPTASFGRVSRRRFSTWSARPALLDACRRFFLFRVALHRPRHRLSRHPRVDHMKVALSVGVQQGARHKAGAACCSPSTPRRLPGRGAHQRRMGTRRERGARISRRTSTFVFKPLLGRPPHPDRREDAGRARRRSWSYGPTARKRPARRRKRSTEHLDHEARSSSSFVLSDAEVLPSPAGAAPSRAHYGRPMDVEWAKDGEDGQLLPSCRRGRRPCSLPKGRRAQDVYAHT